MKLSKLAVAVFASTVLPAFATAITTDIVAVVDESGSMSSEHAWLGGMMTSLDTALAAAAGLDPYSAQFGLVGFGGSSSSGHLEGHAHDMDPGTLGTQEFGTSAQFDTATGGLVLNGGTEDGYSGISAGLGYTGQVNSIRNLILVTDEDRDNLNTNSHTYASIANDLSTDSALLNAVINSTIRCGDQSIALGVDSGGTGYKADGQGGFTTCTGASSSGSSWNDYGLLALGTGGAAWDLNQLRAGGSTAASFTAAFVAVKVQETTTGGGGGNNVPEPSSLGLLGLGLAGLVWGRRKAKQ